VNRTQLLVVLVLAVTVVNVSWTAAVDNRTASVSRDVEQLERGQAAIATSTGVNGSVGQPVNVSLYAYDTDDGSATAVPTRVVAIPTDSLYVDVRRVSHTAPAQQATQRAWNVANASAVQPPYRGAAISMSPPQSWDTVGGESAALGLALGFAATDPCVSLNRSVAVTGGLDASGTVTEVAYVEEKAIAARENGVARIVVPEGQGVAVNGISVVEVTTFESATEQALDVDADCTQQ